MRTAPPASGSVKDVRVFFCPSQPNPFFKYKQNTSGASLSFFNNHGGNADPTGANDRWMGYAYQVHHKTGTIIQASTGNSFTKEMAANRETTGFPLHNILAVDIIKDKDSISHRSGSGAYFVATFIDGHAEAISSPKAVQLIEATGDVTTASDWSTMDPVIKELDDRAGN